MTVKPPARPVGNPLGPGTFPLYRYRWAPDGLATRRQLRALGLRPGGQAPVGRIVWRAGRRFADLYEISRAAPVRPMTAARWAALAKAMTARRTCPACGRDVGYCLPRRWGVCLDCHDAAEAAHESSLARARSARPHTTTATTHGKAA